MRLTLGNRHYAGAVARASGLPVAAAAPVSEDTWGCAILSRLPVVRCESVTRLPSCFLLPLSLSLDLSRSVIEGRSRISWEFVTLRCCLCLGAISSFDLSGSWC